MEIILLIAIIALVLFLAYSSAGGGKPHADHDDTKPRHHFEQKKKALSNTARRQALGDLPLLKVGNVIDGDTVTVLEGRHEIRIRLDSIDCPEDGQHWGDIAKYGLVKLVGGKKVRVEIHGKDSYGRTLATLYVWHGQKNEWLNVNERMVTLGHAWVMRKYYGHLPADRQKKLNSLERWAKSKKVGLWKTPNPTPPWSWRKQAE